MTAWLIKMFVCSLIVTIIIEAAVAYCLRIRTIKKLLLITLVNILTNPPAVLLHWLGSIYLQDLPDLYLQLVIEIIVIVTETLIYQSFSNSSVCKVTADFKSTERNRHLQTPQWYIPHTFILSLVTNICSWTAGIILF